MMSRSGEKKQEENKNETDLEMILLKTDPPHILFSHPLVYRPSEAAKM